MTDRTVPAEDRSSRPGRSQHTVGDLVRSLALVLVVVGVVVLLTLRDEPKQTVREVGYGEQLAATRRVAPYDVLAPVGLPTGWKATSVRGDNTSGAVTWHIGFVTPRESYAAVEQSDGPGTRFIEQLAHGSRPTGSSRIGGQVWQRRTGGDPEERALVMRGPGVTTVVAGSAGWGELRVLAAALRGS